MFSLRTLFALGLCLLAAPMHCVKIGVAHNYNTSTTTTTTTTTAPAAASTEIPMTTITLDFNSTDSTPPETASSTPSQTFPPRKTQKPRTTTTTITTAAPTTSMESLNATEAPTPAPARQDQRFYYCACDLQSDICEVNCCCDRDCPPETLQVFSCSQIVQPAQLQTRLEDFQYKHGLPTCQLNDGWLCVFRSNTKPPKMQTLSSNFDAAQYNKWPELLGAYETQMPHPQFTPHYKFGQALQLWQPESRQLASLELPIAFESANCQLRQTLLHLQPMRSSCLMADAAQLQGSLWSLLNVTSSHQLLSRPRDPDDGAEMFGIGIEVCQQLLLQPKLVCLAGNETQLDMLVDSIELQLVHNYTHILEAKLLLKEAAVRTEHEPLWLSYALIYKSINPIPARPSSGPLGYVQGAPLLLATLHNNSETELDYFRGNVSGPHQHWLAPCPTSWEQRNVVGFGVDVARQCQLLAALDNRTDYCQQLQAHIWRTLLPNNCTRLEDLGQVFVSQLGKPQPDKWLPLKLSLADGQQLPPVQGVYDEQQQSLSCRNMLLSVSYEFHVAELTLLEGRVPHQSVLQHARLVLGRGHDLEFDAGEQHVELPLAVSVMFFKAQDKRPNGSNTPKVPNDKMIWIISLMILLFAGES